MFPQLTQGTDGDRQPAAGPPSKDGNRLWLSGFVLLLPYIEQQQVYEMIQASAGGVSSMGAGVNPDCCSDYRPFRVQLPVLLCPSDGGSGRAKLPGAPSAWSGDTNFVFCTGDELASTICNGENPARDFR